MTLDDTTLLTASQVGHIVHAHRSTVRRWARAGKIPHVRTGSGEVRFPVAAFRAWLRDTYGANAALLLDQPAKRRDPRDDDVA